MGAVCIYPVFTCLVEENSGIKITYPPNAPIIASDFGSGVGIVGSKAGKVRTLPRDELLEDRDLIRDQHFTIWEGCQYLKRAFENDGEQGAAVVLKQMGGANAEAVKELAYVLYDIAGNKHSDAKEATAYNGLITVWNNLTNLAATVSDGSGDDQSTFDL